MLKNKNRMVAAIASMAAAAVILTGCASTVSSEGGTAIEELDRISYASLVEAEKKGFEEEVKAGDNEYLLVFNPEGNDGKGQSGMQTVAKTQIDQEGNSVPVENPEPVIDLDTGVANFDPAFLRSMLSTGPFFEKEGGTVKKNSDGSFTIQSMVLPETKIFVANGLITGIEQKFDTGNGNTQTMVTKITYGITDKGKKMLEEGAKNPAPQEPFYNENGEPMPTDGEVAVTE